MMKIQFSYRWRAVLVIFVTVVSGIIFCQSLSPSKEKCTRRQVIESWSSKVAAVAGAAAATLLVAENFPSYVNAMDTPNALDVDNFLTTGMVAQPMGVSGQAGKSKPETGVVLREGSEVSRDARSGDVFAEILVKRNGNFIPVVASFSSPWPLATGTAYDVECRDARSGDGAFLAVSTEVSQSLADINDTFFVNALFGPTGRFSSYGQPTDINVKKSSMSADNKYKTLDISFSTLSQATQTEIPRLSRIIATIPNGSNQAVMLVGSASATRWRQGADQKVASTIDSFRVVAAPQTGLKIRPKEK